MRLLRRGNGIVYLQQAFERRNKRRFVYWHRGITKLGLGIAKALNPRDCTPCENNERGIICNICTLLLSAEHYAL